MDPHGDVPQTRAWGQRLLVGAGFLFGTLVVAYAGIFTFLSSAEMTLHPNPSAVPSVAASTPPERWASVTAMAREIARSHVIGRNLPGLSVAVGIGDDLVWAEGIGFADLEKRVPLTPDMRFRIGHASKTLTSAAVGLLLEQGTLDLDDEIQMYVPGFPKKQWTVTLRQLMGHVAGIRHYDGEDDYMPTTHCARASDAAGLAPFADDPLRFQPESAYSYSTYGWVLVSAGVEAAAGEPFFTFMRARVFEPLGMHATTSDSVTTSIPNLATFYYPRLSGDTTYGPELATPVDYSCFAGAGAFLSTASDMVHFGIAMNRGTLLKPETVSLLQTRQQLLSGQETEYGLGWMIETVPVGGQPAKLAHHASVTMLGGSATFMTLPEHGVVVALLSNTSRAGLKQVGVSIATAFAEASR